MLPIARGMKKLHARGWFHGDLKALNILVGKGRAMVTNEDNEALAEMISPYLFLSIMIGEYENYVQRHMILEGTRSVASLGRKPLTFAQKTTT
jgi:serine/threonine protein kinase